MTDVLGRKISESPELTVEPSDNDLIMFVDVSDTSDGPGGTNKKMLWSTMKKGTIKADTSTSYTTSDSDNGKIITLSNPSPDSCIVHQTAQAGFNCMIIQKGAGRVTVSAGGTGAILNRQGHTKLAGQYAFASILVESNAGTAPQVYLQGDTSL